MHLKLRKMAESRIITSQYVEIEQTPAGIGERIFARIIDSMIIIIYCQGMIYFFSESKFYRGMNENVLLVITCALFLPALCYSFLWETFNRGRSPGKAIFGVRVVMQDGTTPTAGVCFLRWSFLIADFWFSWLGLFVMLLNNHNQRLGDIASGTIVIKERDYHRIHVSLDEYDYLRKGYRPSFPQADNLTLEQVSIITETLTRTDPRRKQRIDLLAAKAQEYLNISSQTDNETFLRTLLRDYQYYALDDIN